jgi:O-antigen ligase
MLLSLICFTAIFVLGFVIPIRIDFDGWTTLDVLRSGGILGFRDYWSGVSSSTARAITTLSGYLLIFLHAVAQSGSRELNSEIRSLLKGFAIGLICSIAILVCQSQGVGSGILQGNFTEYWRTLKQYPAAATDPNALAIFAALLFPLVTVVFQSKRWKYFVLSIFFILGLFSGSRTFLLALFVVGAVIFYFWIRRFERKELTLLFGVGVVGVFSAVVLLGQPTVNGQLQKLLNFPASIRVLKSIHWHERTSMFASRVIFSKVALQTWRESPIIGVGVERFFDHEKASMEKLGIDLGGFTDNANNYYLQILSENGILGFSLFLISISLLIYVAISPTMEEGENISRKLELAGSKTLRALNEEIQYPSLDLQFRARITLGVFLALLLTGAHLLSPEVQVLVAILLVAAFSRPSLIRKSMSKQLQLLVAFSLFFFALGEIVLGGNTFPTTRTKGFYSPESASLPLTRWSGSKSRIVLCNNTADTVKFRFRSLKPGSEARPQKVVLHEGDVDLGDTTQQFELTNTEWTEAIVNLRPDANGRFLSPVISMRVDSIWSPANLNIGSDPRWLGVLVELPKGTC